MNGMELARALGTPERKMYYWAQRGWIRPKRVDAGRWRGDEMHFSRAEQEVARLMVELIRCGMYPSAAAKVARGGVGALDRLLAALATGPQVVELRYRLSRDGRARERAGLVGLGAQAGEELAFPSE